MQVVHGLSVPLGKLGYHLPRTISSAIESREVDEPEPFRIREHLQQAEEQILRQRHHRPKEQRGRDESPPRPVFRIGGSVIRPGYEGEAAADVSRAEMASLGSTRRPSQIATEATREIPNSSEALQIPLEKHPTL